MNSGKYISNIFIKLYAFLQRHQILRRIKIITFFIDFFLLLFIKKPNKQKNPVDKKKIIFVYNLALGDSVIWICSMKKIRKLYDSKNYEITLICQKGLQSLFQAEKVFDIVIPLEFTEATVNLKKRFSIFKILRSEYYDIMIDPIGVAECTTNVFMSRAIVADEKITVLDKKLGQYNCPKWLVNNIYTDVKEIDISNLSLIEFYAEFIRKLGFRDFEVSFIKPVDVKPNIDIPDSYFIVFPSASTYLKCWPIDRYAEITKKIYKKTGLKLLLCGTEKDRNFINEYIKLLNNEVPYYDIVGKTKLLEFINVIKRSSLIITNDTSTYHIAAVCEIPVGIITGGYTYDRYVEYRFLKENKFKKPCIIVNKRPCFNCGNRCPYLTQTDKIWPCLDEVTVSYAWKKIEKLIEENNIGGE